MHSIFPHLPLFSSTLFLGTIIALSSNQWIYIWIGLEINLLSFIPLVISQSNNQETEAAIKYFLAQATGSGLLLLGALNYFFYPIIFSGQKTSCIFILIGLIIKLGMAPCHFWFPSVIRRLSWTICLILTTWQKLVPLLIVFFLLNSIIYQLSLIPAALSRIIGGIGGLNQTQLRPLLAYSSIGHMGWIFAASFISASTSTIYFLIYIIIISPIILIIKSISKKSPKEFSSLSKTSISSIYILILCILSLGGLPPLTGFFPKWITIEALITRNQWLLTSILIIGSLINLSYYLNIFFSVNIKSQSHYQLVIVKTSPILLILTLLASLTLPLATTIITYAMIIFNKP